MERRQQRSGWRGAAKLVDLPASLLPLLVARHRDSEDEQVLLGLLDLLLAHPARADWHDEIIGFLRTTPSVDLFGLVAMQIVVTRDQSLIDALRTLHADLRDPARRDLVILALENT